MIDRRCLIILPYRQLTAPQLYNAPSIYVLCSAVCTAVQFALKLCTVHFSSPAWPLIDGQACPVFQATSGHPGKPLAKIWPSSQQVVLWPSRPSSDLPGQSQARQKLGSTHCLGLTVQSPLSGSSSQMSAKNHH